MDFMGFIESLEVWSLNISEPKSHVVKAFFHLFPKTLSYVWVWVLLTVRITLWASEDLLSAALRFLLGLKIHSDFIKWRDIKGDYTWEKRQLGMSRVQDHTFTKLVLLLSWNLEPVLDHNFTTFLKLEIVLQINSSEHL